MGYLPNKYSGTFSVVIFLILESLNEIWATVDHRNPWTLGWPVVGYLRICKLCKSHSKASLSTAGGVHPFLGMQLLNKATQTETKVYVKPTNTSLLLHYQSHVDSRLNEGCWKPSLSRVPFIVMLGIFFF